QARIGPAPACISSVWPGWGAHGAAGLPRSDLPSPVRRDSAPDCEAGASPDIPRGCVVVLLRRTHQPADHQLRLTRKNGKEMTMEARFDYLGSPLALKFVKHVNSAGAVVHDSALPAATQE